MRQTLYLIFIASITKKSCVLLAFSNIYLWRKNMTNGLAYLSQHHWQQRHLQPCLIFTGEGEYMTNGLAQPMTTKKFYNIGHRSLLSCGIRLSSPESWPWRLLRLPPPTLRRRRRQQRRRRRTFRRGLRPDPDFRSAFPVSGRQCFRSPEASSRFSHFLPQRGAMSFLRLDILLTAKRPTSYPLT